MNPKLGFLVAFFALLLASRADEKFTGSGWVLTVKMESGFWIAELKTPTGEIWFGECYATLNDRPWFDFEGKRRLPTMSDTIEYRGIDFPEPPTRPEDEPDYDAELIADSVAEDGGIYASVRAEGCTLLPKLRSCEFSVAAATRALNP
ncbi:MAG: hypothetical protein ABMA13_18075 [Chthoniobacteraceae bacterium]